MSSLEIESSRLVFVGGLHRSGTTPFGRVLAEHRDISGLAETTAAEDEGQHLQSVYPPAKLYGGSGHFARDPRAHLTETSSLVSPQNAQALLEAWRPHWDLSRPYLVEKSPPNILMARFLQALYPDAAFIMVIRHPVTVALSTKKWTRLISRHPRKFATLAALVEHWLIAHRLLASDIPHLRRVHVVHYEDLMQQPTAELQRVREFLKLAGEIPHARLSTAHSEVYENWWRDLRSPARPGGWQRRRIEHRFGTEIAHFGYDLDDLSQYRPPRASDVAELSQG